MRLEPCNGRIICRERKRDQISSGGILLPSLSTTSGKSITKNVVLEVLMIGPGERHASDGQRRPIDACKVGDLVMVDRRVCEPLYADGEMYYAIDESVIVARVYDPESRILVPDVAVAS